MIKLVGHIVADGEQLWLISSAAEAGFRVKGASRLTLKLRADDSVTDPARVTELPRFEILLDGMKILDARLRRSRRSRGRKSGTRRSG